VLEAESKTKAIAEACRLGFEPRSVEPEDEAVREDSRASTPPASSW